MLHAPDARVLDVPLACGFKTQQHFAQVFRNVWGVSATEYRQDRYGSEATCACETCSEDTRRLVVAVKPRNFSLTGCRSLPCYLTYAQNSALSEVVC